MGNWRLSGGFRGCISFRMLVRMRRGGKQEEKGERKKSKAYHMSGLCVQTQASPFTLRWTYILSQRETCSCVRQVNRSISSQLHGFLRWGLRSVLTTTNPFTQSISRSPDAVVGQSRWPRWMLGGRFAADTAIISNTGCVCKRPKQALSNTGELDTCRSRESCILTREALFRDASGGGAGVFQTWWLFEQAGPSCVGGWVTARPLRWQCRTGWGNVVGRGLL